MGDTYKSKTWKCKNCFAKMHWKAHNCTDCGKGYWFAPKNQGSWNRARSQSRKPQRNRWEGKPWDGDGPEERDSGKEDAESHSGEEDELQEPSDPESCKKQIEELEQASKLCKHQSGCKHLWLGIQNKPKMKRALLEELDRKPTEAMLRSLLDKKNDRTSKVDTLTKRIASLEEQLVAAKEQHDTNSKELAIISKEVIGLMQQLNLTQEQVEQQIPKTPESGVNKQQRPHSKTPSRAGSAHRKRAAEDLEDNRVRFYSTKNRVKNPQNPPRTSKKKLGQKGGS